MRLKFWKKVVKEKPKPKIQVIDIPKEHIEEVLELYSNYTKIRNKLYLQFKDLIIEFPNMSYVYNQRVDNSLKHEKYLMWKGFCKCIPELSNDKYDYQTEFNESILKPYFERILVEDG